jgi:hypothetical protein
MIKVEDELEIGIERDGVWHTKFTMHAATIADVVTSVEKSPEDASNLILRIYKAAEQIDHIGDITDITGEMLLALADVDIQPIFGAQDEIEKKRKGLSSDSSPTSTLTLSSDATDTITLAD